MEKDRKMGRWIRALICCGMGLMFCPCHAGPVMTISTLIDPDPATIVATKILTQAYAKMGMTLKIEGMPGERSLVSANTGATDGELYRKADIEKLYPNLRMVPVPLMRYEIVAFCRCTPFAVNGWESLKPYRIGFVKGIKIIEQNTVGMQVEPVRTLKQAFLKLELGRTDIVLANRVSGNAELRSQHLNGVIVLQPALASFQVYHYLSRNHEELVPKLTEILRQMEKEGKLERIQRDVLDEF